MATGLVGAELAKLVAAVAMWQGKQWSGDLLVAMIALLFPLGLRQAIVAPR